MSLDNPDRPCLLCGGDVDTNDSDNVAYPEDASGIPTAAHKSCAERVERANRRARAIANDRKRRAAFERGESEILDGFTVACIILGVKLPRQH